MHVRGGIGTFVNASFLGKAVGGYTPNDSIRVDASDVRARIVSEGANLGVTQDGRIELARRGASINSDAVDNSAGVASSDLEVNIKILLAEAQRQGELDPKARIELLKTMTESVAGRVLAGNHAQTLALGLLEADAANELGHHAAYIALLERSDRLNRSVERLPTEDVVEDRRLAGAGLTRPELSVVMAHGKLHLFDELLASETPDDPWFEDYLRAYFPEELSAFPAATKRHRLRREIVATELANEIVDIAGPTFVTRVRSSLACETGAVASAFAAAGEIFGLRALWKRINELDRKLGPAIQYPLYGVVARAWRKQASRLAARLAEQPLEVAKLVDRYTPHVEQLRVRTAPSLDMAEELISGGVSAELALEVVALSALGNFLAITDIALDSERDIAEVAGLYNEIGARFGLARLQSIADDIPTADAIDSIAVRQVAAGLRRHHERLCRSVVEASSPGSNASAAFERWVELHIRAAKVGEDIAALDRPSMPWNLGRLVLAHAAVERAAA
jgi:glutamate dehydrogenase